MHLLKMKLNACVFIIISVLTSACGGGGGSGGSSNVGSSNVGSNSPQITNASMGGIWHGTSTRSGAGETSQIAGFITEAGELRFLAEDMAQLVGHTTVNGNNFTANITSYAPIGYVFENGETVISGTASGTINERSTFSGSAMASGEVTSTFNFTYDPIYERNSSLSAISGIYSETDMGNTLTIAINSQGVVTGNDTDGCGINGNIQILNSSFNMYRLTVTVTNCAELDGNYTGLTALMDEDDVQNNLLVITASGSNYILTFALPRA